VPNPWAQSLGERAHDLHPRLRDYFSEIPSGSVGRGAGTFSRVGSTKWWLRPVLAVLAWDGIVFAVWETDVPFSIENRSAQGGVLAERSFHFEKSTRVMTDAISYIGGTLVDRLGRHGRVVVTLHADVVDRALVVRSSRVSVLGVRVPRFMSPRVHLVERFDDADELQHVSLTLTSPAVGRIYEYEGYFSYAIHEGK
jgi:Domain of unknown function (DUF4166)